MIRMRGFLAVALLLCCIISADAQQRTISSVAELAQAAQMSGVDVKMTPGVYKMSDYLTSSIIKNAEADGVKRKAMIRFSGDNNSFDLTGVTIEVDTKQLALFRSSINEIHITGNNILFKGLTLTDVGNSPPAGGGARSFVISGNNVKVDGVTINISGSSPYGYGDLLGKGGGSIVRLQKHSGLLVEGLCDTIINCKIYSKSFGHLYFVQGGQSVHFENCYAEAQVRPTDEMLKERSGMAKDVDFKSAYKNFDGENKIVAGYMKSLSECGFRTYGKGGVNQRETGAVSVKNCRAVNTRIGFAFTRVNEDMWLEDCSAEGCEVGYSLAGVDVRSSRGDAMYGPLLNITKAAVPSNVELALMPATSKYTIHALAAITGQGHNITLTKYNNLTRKGDLPIKIGVNRPSGNNGYSPVGNGAASKVTLNSSCGMSVYLSPMSSSCVINADAKIDDEGKGNNIK